MGKPPELLTKGGRANPIEFHTSTPLLDPQTSIAEVRLNVGISLLVARITPSQELTLLDLRNPREISPFAIDADNLLKLLNDLNFSAGLATNSLKRSFQGRQISNTWLVSIFVR